MFLFIFTVLFTGFFPLHFFGTQYSIAGSGGSCFLLALHPIYQNYPSQILYPQQLSRQLADLKNQFIFVYLIIVLASM